MTTTTPADLINPVHATTEDADRQPEPGLALCLSGGGYRAMVFHAGVLWRLNEVGMLPKLDRISSVSGGSITSGVLAKRWDKLAFDGGGVATNFVDEFVASVRRMSATSVDIDAILSGMLRFGDCISDRVAAAYRKHLFDEATLQDLPDRPRFVFNATDLESGTLMRFSKPYLGDYRVGRVMRPALSLAVAVAASSGFPPVLWPCTLDLRDQTWVTEQGSDLSTPGYRDRISLTDGGVYDNLGLETAWKRYTSIIVSDAGEHMADEAGVLSLVDNQLRALRKRQVVESFKAGFRTGTYFGIRSRVDRYSAAVLHADPKRTQPLAELPTRLAPLSETDQKRLINWGYIICDAGLRTHMSDRLPTPVTSRLPYPQQSLS